MILLAGLLEKSKYLSVIIVLLTLLAALAPCLGAAMSFVTIVLEAVQEGPWLPKVVKEAAIGFLSMIDLLLIAIGMQTIAIGVYRIFLNKMVAIVLSILFLEAAFKLGPGQPVLYFGLAIAAVIAAFAWAISQEKKTE